MTDRLARLTGEIAKLRLAAAFLTRLPVGGHGAALPLAQAARYFPLAGLLVGLGGLALLWALARLGLPLVPAALLTVLFQVWLTRGLHEDGLADVADGLGGGWTREKRLDIMKDSRSGAFGVIAIVGALGLRVVLLAALAQIDLRLALTALLLAAVLSRFSMLGLLVSLPPARTEGLGSEARSGSGAELIAGGVTSLILFLLLLGPGDAFSLVAGLALVTVLFGWKMKRALGGQTGDVLGAMQQIAEVTVLLVLLARAA